MYSRKGGRKKERKIETDEKKTEIRGCSRVKNERVTIWRRERERERERDRERQRERERDKEKERERERERERK